MESKISFVKENGIKPFALRFISVYALNMSTVLQTETLNCQIGITNLRFRHYKLYLNAKQMFCTFP